MSQSNIPKHLLRHQAKIDALSETDRERFEERAAIIEYDGNTPKTAAEVYAFRMFKI
jgi:hypothetical protein